MKNPFKKTADSAELDVQNMDIEIESATETKAEQPKEEGNVFANLFPKKEESESKDNLIQSLNKATQTESTLKPSLTDDELLRYKKPTLGSNILKASIVLCFLSFGFFYTQLAESFDLFGQNPVHEKQAAYNRVVDLQADILKRDYTLTKHALDDFLFTADTYLHKINMYNSKLISQREKLELEKEFPTLRTRMREDLLLAKESYASKTKLTPDGLPSHPVEDGDHSKEFLAALKDGIRKDIQSAGENPEEVEFFRSITRLADNASLKSALNKYQIPSMNDSEFEELVEILSDSNTSSFGTLNTLRESRVEWSDIVSEIERVTKQIDPVFGTSILGENVGSIFYTSYTIDKSGKTISVMGETATDDGKNFSLSADLIDKFEASPLFKNINMNSFAKSVGGENQFKGVLTLTFELEDAS